MKIARTAEGPKQLFVILEEDPEMIALDIKEGLKNLGFKVVLNVDEGKRDLVRKVKAGKEIIKDASVSDHRYELVLNYKLSHDRFTFLSATLRDKQENELIGTYMWHWNRLLPAPNVQKGMMMLHNKFLSQIFR